MSCILGIDPGSRITGYGVIERSGGDIRFIGSGIIRTGAAGDRSERLVRIKRGVDEIIRTYRPVAVAIEQIFLNKNPRSTMVLGEARGVALLAAAEAGVAVFEYAPREVKNSVVGKGSAHKSQVAMMIGKLLRLDHEPATDDETDALAVAFCHALRESGTMGRLS